MRFELIILAAVIIILFRFVTANSNVNKPGSFNKLPEKLPYSRKFILTKPEYQFYQVLKKVCDEKGYMICPKVGLKDLGNVSSGTDYKLWFNKIAAKHVDFVITDGTLKPYAAVELDDKSHNRADVKEKDAFKDKFFLAIDLPLYRFSMKYTEDEIRNQLFKQEAIDAEAV